jgi:hypothetical protein
LDEYEKYNNNPKTGVISTVQTYTGKRDEESHLTTPEAIELQRYFREMVDSGINYVTMEVSSQAYKYDRIRNMTFDVGLFLNISEDHISDAEHPNFNDYLDSNSSKNVGDIIIFSPSLLYTLIISYIFWNFNAKILLVQGNIGYLPVHYWIETIRESNYAAQNTMLENML